MALTVKQTPAEAAKIGKQVEAWLKQKNFVLPEGEQGLRDSQMVANYLISHHTVNNVVDASFENYRAAFVALRDSISWKSRPAKVDPNKREANMPNWVGEAEAKEKAVDNAILEKEKTQLADLGQQCLRLISVPVGNSHGRRTENADAMRKLFDKLSPTEAELSNVTTKNIAKLLSKARYCFQELKKEQEKRIAQRNVWV